jgi:hypothetical protein
MRGEQVEHNVHWWFVKDWKGLYVAQNNVEEDYAN